VLSEVANYRGWPTGGGVRLIELNIRLHKVILYHAISLLHTRVSTYADGRCSSRKCSAPPKKAEHSS
jgi:hypothetical protein